MNPPLHPSSTFALTSPSSTKVLGLPVEKNVKQYTHKGFHEVGRQETRRCFTQPTDWLQTCHKRCHGRHNDYRGHDNINISLGTASQAAKDRSRSTATSGTLCLLIFGSDLEEMSLGLDRPESRDVCVDCAGMSPVVAVPFVSVVAFTHDQLPEGLAFVASLCSACACDMVAAAAYR